MKTALLFFTAIIFGSSLFGQYRWQIITPIKDTTGICELRIQQWECTGCLAATVMSGEIKVPHYWEGKRPVDGIGAALLFTESTFGVLFGRNYGSKKVFNEYLVRGKIIGIVPQGPKGIGSGYVFDVYQYKLLGKADPDIEGYKDTTTQ